MFLNQREEKFLTTRTHECDKESITDKMQVVDNEVSVSASKRKYT